MSKVTVMGIAGNTVFLPVENFHMGGETVEARNAHFEYGGKGFNQAVAAARFGAEVTFIAAVGNDGYDGIYKFLENEGIKPCLVKKDTPTAFAAVITDKTGLNRVTVFRGAQLEPEDLKKFADEIENADVLLINNEVAESVNISAVNIAKGKIILNPAPARKLPKEFLDKIDIFTPNEHEAEGLYEYDNIIQTLGKEGCLIKSENITVPPTDDKAVDTTGAGDTFNGVLACELALGKSLKRAVEMAVKASGKSVTRKGAVSSIPYKKEII